MSTVDSIGSAGNVTTSQPATGSSRVLGKDDFLRLLATQLRFQNPLEPAADTEFIAQLAEFSSLEQMQNANANLETMTLLSRSLNNALATTLVGKDAKVSGNTVRVSASGQVPLTYALSGPAEVTVKIYDANDRLVRSIAAGSQPAGENDISWDGKDDGGERLPEGNYYYKVEAADDAGSAVAATTYAVGRISGIKFVEGTAMILMNGRQISLADIVEVME